MKWEALGFKDNPFVTDPITRSTIALYTGRSNVVSVCENVLSERNVLMIVEGARGVGTTSFANYLRFNSQEKKDYFTPSNEIGVGAKWTIETLLAVIVANVVREIEVFHSNELINDQRFQNAKALSARISETFRSFGIEAFGFGASYGKNAGISSQPVIVPAPVLGHHLEDLAALVVEIGYKYGLLIQLNNLDVGAIHEESHLKYLFNELRDYIQIQNISWICVGDVGLRSFIAQQVDRLDDIVNYEVELSPLSEKEYGDLIQKRIKFFRSSDKAELPIEEDVFTYLFKLTEGRLRYVFGLLKRLLNELHVGDLTDKLTLEIAKPMVIGLARQRLSKNNLTTNDKVLLRKLVDLKNSNVTKLAKETGKSLQYVSKTLLNLAKLKLVNVQAVGKKRFYSPEIDVVVAYSKFENNE